MDGKEFEQQLHQLVAKADENDVSLLGCYDFQTGKVSNRSLQLEVTEVASDTGSRLLSRE
ncbi:hypothetical protein [Halococcus hamelinensis]|uniref:hypothetical protein n=1 Tax=Halococcus hamelinensis TaxID=332168 RepID=UPI00049723FC|nr:hypothetical protein [Halococcus hamelinensis]